ncbi:MAG: Phospholipase D precursor [Syntrophus sp. PtaB.Bin138]|nr:MAG: Phospholipase D precursor [Syntrophus sp. PtaB.Bin138]
MAYCFTSVRIAKALVDAKKRGVRVEVIIDKGRKTERYSAVTFFKNQGIPIYIDDLEPLQHNKIMIIDVSTVITGSFNFTKAAERNAENVLIIRSKEMAGIYKRNWERHLNHSW